MSGTREITTVCMDIDQEIKTLIRTLKNDEFTENLKEKSLINFLKTGPIGEPWPSHISFRLLKKISVSIFTETEKETQNYLFLLTFSAANQLGLLNKLVLYLFHPNPKDRNLEAHCERVAYLLDITLEYWVTSLKPYLECIEAVEILLPHFFAGRKENKIPADLLKSLFSILPIYQAEKFPHQPHFFSSLRALIYNPLNLLEPIENGPFGPKMLNILEGRDFQSFLDIFPEQRKAIFNDYPRFLIIHLDWERLIQCLQHHETTPELIHKIATLDREIPTLREDFDSSEYLAFRAYLSFKLKENYFLPKDIDIFKEKIRLVLKMQEDFQTKGTLLSKIRTEGASYESTLEKAQHANLINLIDLLDSTDCLIEKTEHIAHNFLSIKSHQGRYDRRHQLASDYLNLFTPKNELNLQDIQSLFKSLALFFRHGFPHSSHPVWRLVNKERRGEFFSSEKEIFDFLFHQETALRLDRRENSEFKIQKRTIYLLTNYSFKFFTDEPISIMNGAFTIRKSPHRAQYFFTSLMSLQGLKIGLETRDFSFLTWLLDPINTCFDPSIILDALLNPDNFLLNMAPLRVLEFLYGLWVQNYSIPKEALYTLAQISPLINQEEAFLLDQIRKNLEPLLLEAQQLPEFLITRFKPFYKTSPQIKLLISQMRVEGLIKDCEPIIDGSIDSPIALLELMNSNQTQRKQSAEILLDLRPPDLILHLKTCLQNSWFRASAYLINELEEDAFSHGTGIPRSGRLLIRDQETYRRIFHDTLRTLEAMLWTHHEIERMLTTILPMNPLIGLNLEKNERLQNISQALCSFHKSWKIPTEVIRQILELLNHPELDSREGETSPLLSKIAKIIIQIGPLVPDNPAGLALWLKLRNKTPDAFHLQRLTKEENQLKSLLEFFSIEHEYPLPRKEATETGPVIKTKDLGEIVRLLLPEHEPGIKHQDSHLLWQKITSESRPEQIRSLTEVAYSVNKNCQRSQALWGIFCMAGLKSHLYDHSNERNIKENITTFQYFMLAVCRYHSLRPRVSAEIYEPRSSLAVTHARALLESFEDTKRLSEVMMASHL